MYSKVYWNWMSNIVTQSEEESNMLKSETKRFSNGLVVIMSSPSSVGPFFSVGVLVVFNLLWKILHLHTIIKLFTCFKRWPRYPLQKWNFCLFLPRKWIKFNLIVWIGVNLWKKRHLLCWDPDWDEFWVKFKRMKWNDN